MAEQTLVAAKADIIGMSRALTAEPDWPRKSAGDLAGDITPCIACNQCWASSVSGEKIKCLVNPAVGNELSAVQPACSTRKRVLVVGGGPAGLEAARTAAERGARVTCWRPAAGWADGCWPHPVGRFSANSGISPTTSQGRPSAAASTFD
jgi:2,4-dienoyl-CoA reductase (NADPH2)